jgi:hypothetical protein
MINSRLTRASVTSADGTIFVGDDPFRFDKDIVRMHGEGGIKSTEVSGNGVTEVLEQSFETIRFNSRHFDVRDQAWPDNW